MGKQRGALVLILLLLCLVGGWWLLLRTTHTADTSSDATSKLSLKVPVVVHHLKTGNTHTYNGTVTIPGGCGALASGISLTTENPPHITLMLDAYKASDCAGGTAAVDIPFALSFESASSNAPLLESVTSNGASISFTRIEDTP